MWRRSLAVTGPVVLLVVVGSLLAPWSRPRPEGVLLADKSFVAYPTWSFDGSEILFTRYLAPMILHPTTGRVLPALSRPMQGDCLAPHLSPDGRRIVFASRASGWQIHVVERGADPSTARIVTDQETAYGAPKFSPDGRTIICSRGRPGWQKLYLMPTNGGDPRSLDRLPGAHRHPYWSRDGRRIAFSADRHICVVNADGTGLRQVTHGEGAWDDEPAFSPDGSMIVFASQTMGLGLRDLFIVPADGGQPVQWTHLEGRAFAPDWSPDGRSIIFARVDEAECSISCLPAPRSVRELTEKRAAARSLSAADAHL